MHKTFSRTASVFACLALGLASCSGTKDRPAEEVEESVGAVPTTEEAVKVVVPQKSPVATKKTTLTRQPLRDDDGKTLWASPTAGSPLSLAFLPPGSQIMLALRPAALLGHSEGPKVIAALGPSGALGIQWIEKTTHLSLDQIDRLLVGMQVNFEGAWESTLVVTLVEPMTQEGATAQFADATQQVSEGQTVWLAGGYAYYLPSSEAGQVLVVAPHDSIADILVMDGAPPPLRRDIEQLLATSDADRHVTLLVAPNYLFSEGEKIFAGMASRLRNPMDQFLGDGLSGAMLSLHWDENFFIELRVRPTLDMPAERLVSLLEERIGQMANQVEDYLKKLHPHDYSRSLLTRFPAMVHLLATYTRRDFDRQQAILRCYLPVNAGHNLLMGAELALVERAKTQALGQTTPSLLASSQGLTAKISLRFRRDTLENALALLSKEIGTEIVILGQDLQLEGITKNQSFGLDLEDQPAGEILVEILRRANPDKGASGPSDPRQKLVYVIRAEAPGKVEKIFVTTRAQAKERGDQLPAVFW